MCYYIEEVWFKYVYVCVPPCVVGIFILCFDRYSLSAYFFLVMDDLILLSRF